MKWTDSIQKIYDYSPEAIFVPCNIVPYYLPGVKIQIFHGYAAEKKDHWVIRRYFDTYFTQGPFFTEGFSALAKNGRVYLGCSWEKTGYVDDTQERVDCMPLLVDLLEGGVYGGSTMERRHSVFLLLVFVFCCFLFLFFFV